MEATLAVILKDCNDPFAKIKQLVERSCLRAVEKPCYAVVLINLARKRGLL